ncbi:MAG TPA: cytochrome c [Stellaceae bacterium]|nr:cytochrome c [Stellaceae bacterium]
MRRAVAGAVAAALLASGGAAAQFADPAHFQEQDGASLYRYICQGCHMPDARGASGAGTYPALAQDARLAVAGYPVLVVMNGKGGMPGFAAMLTDAQIAAVVNYVRTHFRNAYTDTVTADDVKAVRP